MFDAKYYPTKLQNMINFYILEFCGLNSIVESPVKTTFVYKQMARNFAALQY